MIARAHNQNVDVREVGRCLDADIIIEGSVRKAGEKLRITAVWLRPAVSFPFSGGVRT